MIQLLSLCDSRILPAANQGALFIDGSTISVDDAREVHALAASDGLAQLDAPVSGGVKGAVVGTLAFMVGGYAEVVQRAHPILEPMAGKIIHCGAASAGQAAKCPCAGSITKLYLGGRSRLGSRPS